MPLRMTDERIAEATACARQQVHLSGTPSAANTTPRLPWPVDPDPAPVSREGVGERCVTSAD